MPLSALKRSGAKLLYEYLHYKGGFSQALFFPKLNAGGVPLSAESDKGTRTLRYEFAGKLTSTCQLLKKLDQNFNTVRAGSVCEDLSACLVTYVGRSAGRSNL